MKTIILIAVVVFIMLIGFFIPIVSDKYKGKELVFMCVIYSMMWIPLLIAANIYRRWGV